MTQNQKRCILALYSFGFLYFVFTMPSEMASREVSNYIILLVAYLFTGALGLAEFFRPNYYIFEPYTIAFALYMIIMVIRPMIDIQTGEFFCHGKDVMDGCFKGTIVYMASLAFFQLGYHATINKNAIWHNDTSVEVKSLKEYASEEYTPRVRQICIELWCLGFLIAILFYVFTGRNPITALSLGMLAPAEEIGIIDSSVKFLMKLAFIMIIPWLYIVRFDRSISLKLLTTVLMMLHLIAMGSRYVLIVALVAWLIAPYISEIRSFSFNKALIIFVLLLVGAGAMAFFRGDVRAGATIDMTGFSIEDVLYVFDSDFTIYRAYYCVVEGVPKFIDYQLGRGLIGYSLTSFLPSIIFPYKRNFDNVAEIVGSVINERAKMSGIAYINLGQFYAEFGVLGCIVCMFIFGAICRKLRNLYTEHNRNLNRIILYSAMFPFLMQIIIRGDLAQQLNSLIGIIPPYFVIKWFGRNKGD